MDKDRLLAFSDGVIAIIITIMVLELKVPHGADWAALSKVWPVLLGYVLSFVNIAIYWNNHHHMMHLLERVTGGILWANMHLLFWLSLIPFTTGWMGENHFAALPTALYGVILVMAAVAYVVLQTTMIRAQGAQSALAKAIGRDRKGRLSLALYVTAVPLALWQPGLACALYVLVALMWLIPDRRIERTFDGN